MNRRTFLKHSALLGSGLGAAMTRGWPQEGAPSALKIAASEEFERQHRALTVVDSYSACVDIPDLQKGGVDVVIQAVDAEELLVRVPPQADHEPPPEGVDIWENIFDGADIVPRILESIDAELRVVEANRDNVALATNTDEIQAIVQAGKIALVLMLKSGWINSDLAVLRMYHRRGVRVMALCHLAAFDWADSSAERNRVPGLTAFGRQVVQECNKIGVLVDLSHASDETFWDAMRETRKPVMATHSRCRALSKSPRDVTDDMLKAIAKKGGVVGILTAASRTSLERIQARLRRDRRLVEKYPNPFELSAAKKEDAIVWGTKLNLEHIDHAVKVAGVDHVAVASHCQSSPQWREFTEMLTRHGYSESDTRKILGGNALRVLKAAIG